MGTKPAEPPFPSLPAIALMAALALILPAGTLALATPRAGDGLLLVIHPPWRDGDAIVEGAGGRAFGPVRMALATMATAERPDEAFRADARDAGAWFILDATALAALCGTRRP